MPAVSASMRSPCTGFLTVISVFHLTLFRSSSVAFEGHGSPCYAAGHEGHGLGDICGKIINGIGRKEDKAASQQRFMRGSVWKSQHQLPFLRYSYQ